MPMHTIIHQRRTALGLTQEQVAQRLGVTAPAVNKWEKGTTCPDIALLPPLARLLQTDLNTLLCFREDLTDQEIAQFTRQVSDAIRQAGYAAAFEQARGLLREYPSCGKLLHDLALVLEGGLLTAGLTGEEKRPYEEEIFTFYERLADSGDPALRDSALFMLASKHIAREEYGRAQELLDQLPRVSGLDKRQLQARLYQRQGRGEEAVKLLEQKCLGHASDLQMALFALISAMAEAGEREAAGAVADCCARVVDALGLWPYGKATARLLALEGGDPAETLAALEDLLEAALRPWDMGASPLYRHIVPEGQAPAAVGAGLLPGLLAELEQDPKYAFLRQDPAFPALLDRFRKQCPQPAGEKPTASKQAMASGVDR